MQIVQWKYNNVMLVFLKLNIMQNYVYRSIISWEKVKYNFIFKIKFRNYISSNSKMMRSSLFFKIEGTPSSNYVFTSKIPHDDKIMFNYRCNLYFLECVDLIDIKVRNKTPGESLFESDSLILCHRFIIKVDT